MREECKHGRMFRGLITFPRTNQPRFALFFSSSFFPSQLKTMISCVNRCPRCIFKLIIQSVDSFHFSAESEGSTRVRRKSIAGNLVRASVRNVLTYLISVECILGIETKFRKFPVKLLYFLDNRYLLLWSSIPCLNNFEVRDKSVLLFIREKMFARNLIKIL